MKLVAVSLILLFFIAINIARSMIEARPDIYEKLGLVTIQDWIAPDQILEKLESRFPEETESIVDRKCAKGNTDLFTETRNFVTHHPTKVYGWLLFAKISICVGHINEARRALSTIELLMPSRSKVRRETGELWALIGDLDAARGAFRASITARNRQVEFVRKQVLSITPDPAVAASILMPDSSERSIYPNYLPDSNMRYALATGDRLLADAIWDRSLAYKTSASSFARTAYLRLIEETANPKRVLQVMEQLSIPRSRLGEIQNGGFESELEPGLFAWRSGKSSASSITRVLQVDAEPRTAVRLAFTGTGQSVVNYLSQIVLITATGKYEIRGEWKGELDDREHGYVSIDLDDLGAVVKRNVQRRSGRWKWTHFVLPFEVIKTPVRLRISIDGQVTGGMSFIEKGVLWLDEISLTKIGEI